jgi:hypothetical protein
MCVQWQLTVCRVRELDKETQKTQKEKKNTLEENIKALPAAWRWSAGVPISSNGRHAEIEGSAVEVTQVAILKMFTKFKILYTS